VSTVTRLANFESELADRMLLEEARTLAPVYDLDAEELFAEAQEILRRHGHLLRPGPNAE